MRRRDFVAFARERLGENSEEYRQILAEVYKPGFVKDEDGSDRLEIEGDYNKLRERLEDRRVREERAPITSYLTQPSVSKPTAGVGLYMPLRLAVSLTRPMDF